MSEPTHGNMSRFMHFLENLKGLIIVNKGGTIYVLDESFKLPCTMFPTFFTLFKIHNNF
jgi:hypothetical protein